MPFFLSGWSILLEHKACIQILNISKSYICYISIKRRLNLIKLSELNLELKKEINLIKNVYFIWNFLEYNNFFYAKILVKYMKLSIFHVIWEISKNSSLQNNFIFAFKSKFKTRFLNFFWRMKYYVLCFQRKFHDKKKLIWSKKFSYKIEKYLLQKKSIFKFYFGIRKFCRNLLRYLVQI